MCIWCCGCWSSHHQICRLSLMVKIYILCICWLYVKGTIMLCFTKNVTLTCTNILYDIEIVFFIILVCFTLITPIALVPCGSLLNNTGQLKYFICLLKCTLREDKGKNKYCSCRTRYSLPTNSCGSKHPLIDTCLSNKNPVFNHLFHTFFLFC